MKGKPLKTLRHIHKEIANDIRSRPHNIPSNILYIYLKNNPFQLKSRDKLKPTDFTQSPPKKHQREEKDFIRSFSPAKRKNMIEPTSKTPTSKNLRELSAETPGENTLTSNLYSKEYYEKSLPRLEDKTNLNSEYRKRYDRIFRGKISKSYLNYRS